MNWLVQTPIFVRVSLCLQLRHRRTIGRQFHHLELEQVDVIVEVYSHIHTPMAAAVLYRDIETQAREIGIEHTGIVAFKTGDVVVGVPLIGNTGIKGVESVLSPSKSLISNRSYKTGTVLNAARRVSNQVIQQALVQALPNFRFG